MYKMVIVVLLLIASFSPTTVTQAQEDFSTALISDIIGFEDDSFTRQAWQGLQEFGKKNGLEEGIEGYNKLSALSEADYFSAFLEASQDGYDLIFGVGAQTKEYLAEFSQEDFNQKFVLIDAELEAPNVASVVFKDYEAAFLAGIAAASESQTGLIGFIGGTDNEVMQAFETGFFAGAETINPEIEVFVNYLEGLNDENEAYFAATEMYQNNIDIIFHSAGSAGTGVFEAAKNLISEGINHKIWVIGSDVDQTQAGYFMYEDVNYSITLTSTIKRVGRVVKQLAQETYEGNFEAGLYQYGLMEGAVDLAAGQLYGDTYELVDHYRTLMQSGELNLREELYP